MKLHLIDRLIRYVGNFSGAVMALLVLLVLYDALMRYLFHAGSIALQELEWHLFDIVILFGIAYTLHRGAHVRVDIFYDRFSKRMKALIDIVSALFFILPVSLLIVYVGFDFVALSFAQLEASSDPGGLPYRFVVKSLMPIAFVLLILQALREAADAFGEWREAA
jgi:TRAP-type mannitol/chloroaromatic compound transport system permease small subunit